MKHLGLWLWMFIPAGVLFYLFGRFSPLFSVMAVGQLFGAWLMDAAGWVD